MLGEGTWEKAEERRNIALRIKVHAQYEDVMTKHISLYANLKHFFN